MGKYDHLKEDMFTTRDSSDAEVTTVHALVAIANELAELSEFLRDRMPPRIPTSRPEPNPADDDVKSS